MELKTKLNSVPDRQEINITRVFDLPVEKLFKAFTTPEIVAQWMGTKVLKLEHKTHGGWQFETSDANGNVLFRANGVIHSIVPDKQIIRTFEMENTPLPAQLEFFDFEQLTENTSRLNMQIICRSVEVRDQLLKLPFAAGLNMAHNRLQQTAEETD